MLNIDNNTDFTINTQLIEDIVKKHTSRDIDLIVCYNSTIQEYNKTYRDKDKATDVLSFPIENDNILMADMMPLGSIVISIDFVNEKALELGHSTEDEFTLLFIHGLLHLLGYDHETDNGEMREKEEALITELNLPKSLIVRTEES
jgi:probable rRNA maturation factor